MTQPTQGSIPYAPLLSIGNPTPKSISIAVAQMQPLIAGIKSGTFPQAAATPGHAPGQVTPNITDLYGSYSTARCQISGYWQGMILNVYLPAIQAGKMDYHNALLACKNYLSTNPENVPNPGGLFSAANWTTIYNTSSIWAMLAACASEQVAAVNGIRSGVPTHPLNPPIRSTPPTLSQPIIQDNVGLLEEGIAASLKVTRTQPPASQTPGKFTASPVPSIEVSQYVNARAELAYVVWSMMTGAQGTAIRTGTSSPTSLRLAALNRIKSLNNASGLFSAANWAIINRPVSDDLAEFVTAIGRTQVATTDSGAKILGPGPGAATEWTAIEIIGAVAAVAIGALVVKALVSDTKVDLVI